MSIKKIKLSKLRESVESVSETALSAKAGREGKDLGKPGKNFDKIADKAAKEYGSEESGKRVAGAILAKMRKNAGISEAVMPDIDYDKLRKQHDRNEDRNAHSENVVLLAKHFGTPEDHAEAQDILRQHKKIGHLSGDLMARRSSLDTKLSKTAGYKHLFGKSPLSEMRSNPYAVGMAAAEKETGDRPPLKKSTIVKAHDIAKKIQAKEDINTNDPAGMLDTALSDIEDSNTGEIYKKTKEKTTGPSPATGTSTRIYADKEGECYDSKGLSEDLTLKRVKDHEIDLGDPKNDEVRKLKGSKNLSKILDKVEKAICESPFTTGNKITNRNLNLESAISGIYSKSVERRKLFEEAKTQVEIGHVPAEQISDWANVERGNLSFNDYIAKYKV